MTIEPRKIQLQSVIKATAYIIVVAICLDIILLKSDNLIILSIACGILSICSVFLLDCLIEDWEFIGLFLKSYTIYFRSPIRLSISYLIRVKIKNKYLLIQSYRFPHQYIPIGGSYKRLRESDSFFNNIEMRQDDKIPNDSDSVDDLRIFILGRRIPSFIKWFQSGKDRELSPWREFYEELVESGIVSQKNFSYIYYRQLKTHVNGIKYASYFDCDELLLADIYELVPTPMQQLELESLLLRSDSRYIWAESDLIRTGGTSHGKRPFVISDHSTWIL